MNTMSAPARRPGSDSGKYTFQNARVGLAPRLAAAFTRSWSIARIEPSSGSTMNGSMMCTMPMRVPVRLCTSASGSSHRPSPMPHLLTRPCRCSSTSHA